jgi:toxin-antitoxin system PIN domain toxin
MKILMTLFFPDLNVWLALSVAAHTHNSEAWRWLNQIPRDTTLIFSRYTQLGLLRLLTNQSAMGKQTLNLKEAWDLFDRWLGDPRVKFYPEPRELDAAFRKATAPFFKQQASKWVGDCYLLAYSGEADAHLVTFDRALAQVARKNGCRVIVPS